MRISLKFITLFFILGSIWVSVSHAQCPSGISTFPYNENFEANNGNWVAVPSTEWQWGDPANNKPVIRTSGPDSKCWIVGGLSGSTYSSGNSALVSPCFDFTALVNPEISFRVFWETERRFDGASFQYSLDNGNVWTTLGSVNSNNTCEGSNWFTYSPIDYLGGEPGWSGNVQTSGGGGGNCLYGMGSGSWVTAKHNMSMLAGKQGVLLRFIFGAGTQCNDFDGFAVDNIHIGETPPPGIADFSFVCGINGQTQFTNNSASCSVNWNFGDPGSGSLNTSSLENPSHVFSLPGQKYIVTLTANFASGSAVKTDTIYTLAIDPDIISTNKCFGDSDIELSLINPAGDPNGIYTYSWNTNPVQTTSTVRNLPAGNYMGIVSSPRGCSQAAYFEMDDPPLLNVAVTPSPALCGSGNGSIKALVSGGIAPYSYTWNTSPIDSSQISSLQPGMYSLTVTDDYGCSGSVNNIRIEDVTKTLNPYLGKDTTICPGQTLILKPGSFAAYRWQDNSISAVFSVTKTGTYSVSVEDESGCVGTSTINVTVDCRDVFFPSAFTPGTDPVNPTFGATGDLGTLKNYSIVIYNRYAQQVFTSSDPYQKWDGTFKGKPLDTQSFVWTARYTLAGRKPVFKKGTVIIIR